MPHPLIAAVATLLLGSLSLVTPAWAQVASPDTGPFRWDQPPPEVQLAQDDAVIPLGKGAVFVPALTDPVDEPPVILVLPNDEVQHITTGERVMLDPGRYTVIVGSGTPAQGVPQVVEVVDGETTLVEPTWGALRIEVTDGRRVPHRGGYELIDAESREPYGTGFGADTLQGERLLTWLLPPGVYRIVKIGGSYRSLRDFATVYVPEGGYVRYRLATDPDTGSFLGAGVLLPDEFGTLRTSDKPWFTSLVLGVDGALVQQSNVVGVQNQLLLSGDVFLDGQFVWTKKPHQASALIQIEEGASLVRPQGSTPLPLIKSRDRVRADLLYTWFVRENFGPYARVLGNTQAFPTDLVVTEDTTFQREYIGGSVETEVVEAGETFHVADAFTPTIIREGAGVNSRLLNNQWVTFNLRVGLGLRQNLFGGAWLIDDDPATDPVEYVQVESFSTAGLESTVTATAKLPGWAGYVTSLELFMDVRDPARPAIEWRNTLSLRISRNLSVNYFLNLERFPQVVERIQLEQSVLLRASFALL